MITCLNKLGCINTIQVFLPVVTAINAKWEMLGCLTPKQTGLKMYLT